ncbi:MAG: Na/Pi symporter [Prolixibacteraceae bacterium]|jgi:phosphate:Na+ symporter|nr:Na/Pi symporter [Prolixibacteraceae bacterium]
MLETIAYILAGIGLFFVGVRNVCDTLQSITSLKVRKMFSNLSNHKMHQSLWGVLLGMITQSSSTASFIVTGLVSGRLIPLRNAMKIILWAEIGTTFLVFLAAIKYKIAILFLLALTGMLYESDTTTRKSQITKIFFGIGLLLFGFHFVQTYAHIIIESEWGTGLLKQATTSYIFLFIVGVLLRFLAQSSSAVALLAIPLYSSGLIDIVGIQLLVYSTFLGSGITTYLYSAKMKGLTMQLILFKIVSDIIGSIVMVLLLILEHNTTIPLIESMIQNLTSNTTQQVAFLFASAKIIQVIVISLPLKYFENLVKRYSPPTNVEDIAELQYLNGQKQLEPDAVIKLGYMETSRILDNLPHYLDSVRPEITTVKTTPNKLNLAISTISFEMDNIIKELYRHPLNNSTTESIVRFQQQLGSISSLNDTLNEFVMTHFQFSKTKTESAGSLHNITESLHVLLVSMNDSIEGDTSEDYELLINLTLDRGPMMENFRQRYIKKQNELSSDEQYQIMRITELFQRSVWLINNWARFMYKKVEDNANAS